MIKPNTVFVVGAGASVPYGFPTGRGLLRATKDASIEALRRGAEDFISKGAAEALQEALHGSEDDSIDALLEFRPDLEQPGKALIANRLLESENSYLAKSDRDNDWIQYLIARMVEDCRSIDEFCAKNKSTFITYNYDRLVEYKLRTGLQQKWRLHEAKLATLTESVRVIHLHGSLGSLTQAENMVPFGRKKDIRTLDYHAEDLLNYAAKSIRIVHQVATDDAQFSAAREALQRAEVVFFLGFGFGRTNTDRLGLGNIKGGAIMRATSVNMSDDEYTRYIYQPMKSALHHRELVKRFEGNCYDLLNQNLRVLMND